MIVEDLNAPHLDNSVHTIRVFGERLEQRLLDKFESAAMAEGGGGSPDVASMRECAFSLLKFGDAVKLYNTYIYTIVVKQVQAIR